MLVFSTALWRARCSAAKLVGTPAVQACWIAWAFARPLGGGCFTRNWHTHILKCRITPADARGAQCGAAPASGAA